MPRQYTRKTTWGKTPLEEMESAAAEVKEGKKSLRVAAKDRNIDKSSLLRFLKKKDKGEVKSVAWGAVAEAKRIFTDEMEEELAKHLKQLAEQFHGLPPVKCRQLAFEYAKKNNIPVPANWTKTQCAGEDWFGRFLARRHLSVRTPEATSLGRATAFNKTTVGEFFDNLAVVMDRSPMSEPRTTESTGSGCVVAQNSEQLCPKMVSVKLEDCSQTLELNVVVKEEGEEVEENRELDGKTKPHLDSDNAVDMLLRTPFNSLEHTEKVKIKTEGRPLPQIKYISRDQKNRAFNTNWYEKYKWLTGSLSTNRLYCWPCLLVGRSNTWTNEGYTDLKNIDRSAQRHDKCRAHLAASIRLKLLERLRIKQVTDESLRFQTARHNEKVRRNRDILKRLIDTTAFLGTQDLAFREHNKSEASSNKGNYRELAEVIARYDSPLAEHMHSSTVFTGMSETIQNDLISAVAVSVRSEIKREVDAAPFFAWQMDEGPFPSQLSVMVRYVDEQGSIQERFLGFFDTSRGRDAQSVFDVVLSEMSGFNLTEKLVAQSYDGAVVMACDLHFLQAKVRAIAPSATFVHSYAHGLSLVLRQGMKSIPQAKVFFATLSRFTTFFSKSTERVKFLEQVGCASSPKNAPSWDFTSKVVNTVATNYDQLKEALARFVEHPDMDDETVGTADVLKGKLEDFDFIFLLLTFQQAFAQTDMVFDIVHPVAIDVAFCQRHIESLVQIMGDLKSDDMAFDAIYQKAADLTEDPEIMHRRKRVPGTQDIRQMYKALYDSIHDNLRSQVAQRYKDLDAVRFLELLDGRKFKSFHNEFPNDALMSLTETYGHFFDLGRLKAELEVLYCNQEIQGNPKKLCDSILYFQRTELDEVLPELYRLMCLVATIGVTSAGVKSGLSCLDRLRSYSSGKTVGQEQQRGLAILSMERSILKSLQKNPHWYEKVIDQFASQTTKGTDFIFK